MITRRRSAWVGSVRAVGSWGVAYGSVRRAGGECVGVLRPVRSRAVARRSPWGTCGTAERVAVVFEKRVLRG
jgi:hypothetical protein